MSAIIISQKTLKTTLVHVYRIHIPRLQKNKKSENPQQKKDILSDFGLCLAENFQLYWIQDIHESGTRLSYGTFMNDKFVLSSLAWWHLFLKYLGNSYQGYDLQTTCPQFLEFFTCNMLKITHLTPDLICTFYVCSDYSREIVGSRLVESVIGNRQKGNPDQKLTKVPAKVKLRGKMAVEK